jgi:NitT/TauT family transport system substrate-binding protein
MTAVGRLADVRASRRRSCGTVNGHLLIVDQARRRRSTRVAVGLVAMAAVAACGQGHRRTGVSRAAKTVTMAIGGQTQLVYLPTTLARELGFYRDEGLNVELQDFPGGSKALQSLIGGSADVVSGFYDHTIQMQAEGRDVISFVSMLRFPGLVLVTSPQAAGAVTKIADLSGRLAGVTAAGSSSQLLFTYLLHRNGVAADAVSVTAIGNGAAAVAALEHGSVDAGMITDPAFTLLRRRNPGVRVLADLRRAEGVKRGFGSATYPASVLYAKGDWIRANRDTARQLARAIVRTLEWMQIHSPQEIAGRMPAGFRGDDPALYVEALKSSMPMFSPDGRMAADGAESVRSLLAESMDTVRNARIDIAKTFTNELVNGR